MRKRRKNFRALRIRTAERLLEAAKNPKGRKDLADKTGIGEKRLLGLANTADRMRIKGWARNTPRSCRRSASIP